MGAATGAHVLHAAAVAGRDGGGAALFLGRSRAGKSTLAHAAWRAGHEVLGDDVVAVDAARGAVQALPAPLRLRPDALGADPPGLGGLPPAAVLAGEIAGERRVLLARGLPGMAPVGRAYPLAAVYLLERSDAPGWSREPADRLALVRAVIDQTFPGPERPLALLPPFAALWAAGRAFRLRVGNGATEAAVAGIFG
jgi:hypothetical protein